MSIDKSAFIHKNAIIGKNVTIAHNAVIGEFVEIEDNCTINAGVVIDGWTKIGKNNKISPYAVIGTPPQDLKFADEKSFLKIGENNIIREFVTINRGTSHGGGETKIGNNNMIMAYAHVAHDCQVGDYNILANAATLAGHVIVENHISVGGLSGVHQFVKIGSFAFIGGCSAVTQDVLPFALAAGNHASIYGFNVIGLQRKGFSKERISIIKKAYKFLFRSKLNVSQAVEKIKSDLEKTEDIKHILSFIESSDRGIAHSSTK